MAAARADGWRPGRRGRQDHDANYALLEVYNSTTHNGTVLQIPINTDMVN